MGSHSGGPANGAEADSGRTGPGAAEHERPFEPGAAEHERPSRPGAAEQERPSVTPPRPLRRNVPFQLLWIGTSAATLGVSVADIAYPLAILAATGSPALAGLFAAIQALGMLLAGLPAGVLADRYD